MKIADELGNELYAAFAELCASPFLGDVLRELAAAERLHKPINSLHEGYGVLAEEVAEFFDEVRKKEDCRDAVMVRRELAQVAAVAWRIVLNLYERRLAQDVPPGAPETCEICHHTYPQLLFCARCGPSCPACAPAHELVREAQRKALDPGIPPEAPSAVATAPPSSLFAFRALCEANGLTPCDDLSACQWLEALGIPPHAPAAAWATALDEAVERWKHRTSVPEDCPLCHHTFPVSCAHCGPACLACVAVEAVRGMWGAQPSQLEVPAEGCPVSRWMWQANSAGVHDYAHAETPGCVEAGCVVIRDTLSTTDRQEQEARL